MEWEAIGAVAELIGAIGVVASLFYLGTQIRSNSDALRASTNQAISDATQERLLAPAQSLELASAIEKARSNFDGLTPAEIVQLAFFCRATFRGCQNAFFQYQVGLLSETAWRNCQEIIRMNLRRPDVPGWWASERDSNDDGFARYVDKILADLSAA